MSRLKHVSHTLCVVEQVEAAKDAARHAHALVFPPIDPTPPTSSGSSLQQHGVANISAGSSRKPVLCSPELTSALQQLGCLNDELQVGFVVAHCVLLCWAAVPPCRLILRSMGNGLHVGSA